MTASGKTSLDDETPSLRGDSCTTACALDYGQLERLPRGSGAGAEFRDEYPEFYFATHLKGRLA